MNDFNFRYGPAIYDPQWYRLGRIWTVGHREFKMSIICDNILSYVIMQMFKLATLPVYQTHMKCWIEF